MHIVSKYFISLKNILPKMAVFILIPSAWKYGIWIENMPSEQSQPGYINPVHCYGFREVKDFDMFSHSSLLVLPSINVMI